MFCPCRRGPRSAREPARPGSPAWTFALTRPPSAKGGLRVLVDALGVEELESPSDKCRKVSEGVWAVDLSREYSVARPSKLREKFASELGEERVDGSVRTGA